MSSRADLFLVKAGYAESRSKAQAMIAEGRVRLKTPRGDVLVTKPSFEIADEAVVEISSGVSDLFVSRAGLKLHSALEKTNWDLQGQLALDVGQSTGGFTDCLLRRGVRHVVGLDVGRAQLHPKLRQDPRVTCLEQAHVKEPETLERARAALKQHHPDLIAVDLSFISCSQSFPFLTAISRAGTRLALLVKPQFELGPEALDRHGVVRPEFFDPGLLDRLGQQLVTLSWQIEDQFESSLEGKEGNREYFILASRKK